MEGLIRNEKHKKQGAVASTLLEVWGFSVRRDESLIGRLSDDVSHTTGTDGTATFADSEAHGTLEGDRGDQFDFHGDVVARHHHFNAFWELDAAGHVGGTNVELRTVVVEEWGVTATFIFGEDVNLSLELGVWLHGTSLGEHLAAFDGFLLHAAEEETDVVTGTTFVEELTEHFDVGDGRLDGVAETDDFHFFHLLDDTTLDTAGGDGSTTFDREHVFDWHEERLVDRTLRNWDVAVNSFHELEDVGFLSGVAIKSELGGAFDDWHVITWEVISAEEVADFHFDEVEEFSVIHHVNFVHEDNESRNTDLTGEQDVLTSLWHWAVSGGNDENGAVHLSSTSDHVLDIVSVSWAVNVGVVAVVGFVFDVGGVDGNTAGLFFWSGVDVGVALGLGEALLSESGGDSRRQSGLAMVNVTDGADVDVGLVTLEGFFSHVGWWFVVPGLAVRCLVLFVCLGMNGACGGD